MCFRLLEEVLFITVVKYLVSKGADMFPSPLGGLIYKQNYINAVCEGEWFPSPFEVLIYKFTGTRSQLMEMGIEFPSPLGVPLYKFRRGKISAHQSTVSVSSL